jgi:hypothetical protein
MLYLSSNLLTGSMAYCLSHKVFQEKYLLTNSQVAELWKIKSTNLNYSILTEMRALLLNSSVILVIKGFGGKFGVEFLANFLS